MFPDGNGRLARSAYSLLSKETQPTSEIIKSRGETTGRFAAIVTQESNKGLLDKEGLEYENYYDYYTTKGGVSTSDMDTLRYIAARRALIADDVEETKIGKKIARESLTSNQAQKAIEEYEKVRKEFFWETQNFIDTYPDWATQYLDDIVSTSSNTDVVEEN